MADQQPVIIIRRKKKGGEAGHHGGAWKVAYADFVTAMMAFFLLLWLLNVTTDEQRHGIADYFTPASIARSESGAGGMLGGQTITAPGAMMSAGSPPSAQSRTIPTAGQGEEGEEDTVGKSDHGGNGKEDGASSPLPKIQTAAEKAAEDAKPKTAAEIAEQKRREAEENDRFQRAGDQLKQAIQQTPGLQSLSDQLLIDQTPEGLRIQIVDKENSSMFPSGSAILYEKSRDLLKLMGRILARLPNPIAIAGHTDGAAFSPGARRDNWTLSTERANVCRRELEDSGVASARIARVIGMADREPLDASPNAPKNRRISITLLRQNNSAAEDRAALPGALQPAAVQPGSTQPDPPKAAPLPAPPRSNAGPLLPSVLPEQENH